MALFCRAENIVAEPGDHRVWLVRDARPDLRRVVLVARLEPFSEYSVLAGIVFFAVPECVRNQCGGHRVGRSVLLDDDLSRHAADVLAHDDHHPEIYWNN